MVLAVFHVPPAAAELSVMPLSGRPLLAWCVAGARAARRVDRVVILTENASIAALAKCWGVEAHPSGGGSPLAPVEWLGGLGGAPPPMAVLSPLVPFRVGADIDAAVELLESSFCDVVLGVVSAVESVTVAGTQAEPAFPLAGLRLTRTPTFAAEDTRAVATRLLHLPWIRGFAIHDEDDLAIAQILAHRGLLSAPSRLPSPADIDLICYDFDGVMTDNTLILDETGKEAVAVNRGDGLAVAAIRALGIPQVILSTETNPVVRTRAAKLGIDVFHGLVDKAASLHALVTEKQFSLDRVVYVGNDTNDLGPMQLVRYPIAPSNAHPSIIAIACYVTRAPGGRGVIRELYDAIFVRTT